jgi:hypothetical protein
MRRSGLVQLVGYAHVKKAVSRKARHVDYERRARHAARLARVRLTLPSRASGGASARGAAPGAVTAETRPA